MIMADDYKTTATSGDSLVEIPGNTYPVRAELKALGATWDSANRVWRIAPEKLTQARAIVQNQSKVAPEALGAAKKEAAQNLDVASMADPFEESSETRQVPIPGNTYPVKDALKALGATWDKDRRTWMIAESKAEYARAIVSGEIANDSPLEEN